jgi:hypothetical protein
LDFLILLWIGTGVSSSGRRMLSFLTDDLEVVVEVDVELELDRLVLIL